MQNKDLNMSLHGLHCKSNHVLLINLAWTKIHSISYNIIQMGTLHLFDVIKFLM